MFCCTLLYVYSSIAVILMGKRELIALLNLSSWCLVMVERLFLAVPRGCLQFVIVVFPNHTHLLFFSVVFAKLSMYPPVFEDEEKMVLERFVIIMYDRSSSATDIDGVRLDMFARKQKSYDAIPPTNAALEYHIKRASYQAGCIWGQATTRQMEILSPSEWGWKQQDNSWQIIWTSLPPVAESCKQLTKCGCKTACRGRCKCLRFSLP